MGKKTSKETAEQIEKKVEQEIMLRKGNTTYLIGLHYSENKKSSFSDKIKDLARQEVDSGDFFETHFRAHKKSA